MALSVDQPIIYLSLASVGLLARILATATWKESLRHRVEIVTPVGDWKRAHEAIHLWNSGLDPYGGNLFHEYPVSLQFYKIASSYFNVDLAFCMTDVITALLLYQSLFQQLLADGEAHNVSKQRSALVYLLYLFSPLTIMSCAGQSTMIFTNFLIAAILFTLPIKAFRLLSCVLCALLACNNIHYISLILPIFCCMEYSSWTKDKKLYAASPNKPAGEVSFEASYVTSDQNSNNDGNTACNQKAYYSNANFTSSILNSFIICLASILTLLVTSYVLMGNSWAFISAAYSYNLMIGDLTPNIGIYWYFFTEMFDHFLKFFTWIVQMVAFIQTVPLTIAFRERPFFALYIIAFLSTICQPYPSLASIGLITSMLPQYSDLFQHLTQGLSVVCTCITCMCLWPVFWHLWIMVGTANANFYFGATLAFMAALIFLAVDLLNAHAYRLTKIKLEKHDAVSASKQELSSASFGKVGGKRPGNKIN